MTARALGWVAGIVALQWQPVLPALVWLLIGPVLLLVSIRRWRRIPAPLYVVLGFLWAVGHAHWVLSKGVPAEYEGIDIAVVGTVAGLPETPPGRLRFLLDVEQVEGAPALRPGRIRLSWYGRTGSVRPGERWRLVVRLKQPRGYANPGGFDYESWLYRQRVRATGYVRGNEAPRRLGQPGFAGALDRLRDGIRLRIDAALGDRPARGLIAALAIGERSGVGDTQWATLRRTGTTHLLAISGLHVGLVAGFAFALVGFLWRRLPYGPLVVATPRVAAAAALAGAAIYAALAGFAIPTQRALVMVTIFMAGEMLGRPLRPGRALLLALGAVTALDPLAVLSPGFWLSFAAVGAILAVVTSRRRARLWQRWGSIQLAASFGLAPLLLLFFGQVSLVAPVANLLAIPWIGFLVVPAILVGVALLGLWSSAAGAVLTVAASLLDLLWVGLGEAASLDMAIWQPGAAPVWSTLLAAVGIVVLLLPRVIPGRWAALFLLLPMLLIRVASPPPQGAFRATMLDVGQGLAVVVRTANHLLLYDAGPRYRGGFDAGEAVVVPYLRYLGVSRVDTLVVSHADNDHAGGVPAVLREMPARRLLHAPGATGFGGSTCLAGQSWVWDGVLFEVLYPTADQKAQSDNETTCVLRVQAGGRGLLLTGDIERRAEASLVARYGEALRTEVITVPHHGSNTSSTPEFVTAVAPRWSLVSNGYRNRWGFPRPRVSDRYRRAGARILETARVGAMTLELSPARAEPLFETSRAARRRYWQAAFGGEGKSSTIAPFPEGL